MKKAITVEIKGVIDGNRSNSYKVTVLGYFIRVRKNINKMWSNAPYL